MIIENIYKLFKLKNIIDFNRLNELPKVIDEVLVGNYDKIDEVIDLIHYCEQLFDTLIEIKVEGRYYDKKRLQ